MFSIIFSALWILTLKKAEAVTIDGIYITLPILADLALANIIFG